MTRVDENVAESVHEVVRGSDFLIALSTVVSFLGVPGWFFLLIGATSLWLWRRGDRRLAIYLVSTNLIGGAIDTVVKVVVDRPRPEFEEPIAHAIGKSFPSGHAMATTVGYGSLLLVFMPFIPARARSWAIGGYFVWVAMMCASRLGLGVHFLSDVLGGFVLGLAWLAAATAAFNIWRVERRKKPVEVLEGVEPEVA
jgi:undecaprenyl-diphosphatase